MSYIVLDIETTGMSRYVDRITEIAAVKVENGNIIDKFHSLINPKRKIPRFITQLTGIDDDMVKYAPEINEVLPSLKNFLADYPIIAHNASFDMGFLEHNFRIHLNQNLENKKICTLRLANRIPIEFTNRKLGTLCQYFNIINEREHRAMGDTLATVDLMKKFEEILEKNEIKNVDDIYCFCYKPAKYCREKIITNF